MSWVPLTVTASQSLIIKKCGVVWGSWKGEGVCVCVNAWIAVGTLEWENWTGEKKKRELWKRLLALWNHSITRSPQHSIDKRGIFLRKMNATWKWPLTRQPCVLWASNTMCMFNDVDQHSELCWSGVYATQEAHLNNRTKQEKKKTGSYRLITNPWSLAAIWKRSRESTT